MSIYRSYILEAKQAKFTPSNKRASDHKKELQKLQIRMQKVAKSLNQINSSKTMPPKLKNTRIQQEKALQSYLKACITHKQAEISNIIKPE